MRLRWALALLPAGCLFPDLSGLGPASDAGLDVVAESSSDASADVAAQCDPTKPFGAALPVPGIAYSASNGRLSVDETEIVFQTYDDAGLAQLQHATRASRAAAFGVSSLLTTLDTAGDNWDGMLSADGVTLVFSSTRNGTEQLFRATRASASVDFGSPLELVNLTGPYDENKPYVQGLNVALWFESFATGAGDIYLSPSVGGDYIAGSPVTELNTGAEEGFPVVSADATLIYFFRSSATTNDDIWTARRASPTAAFDPPTLVTELDTSSDDDPSWMSADLCRLYFTSNRGGNYMLYFAQRAP